MRFLRSLLLSVYLIPFTIVYATLCLLAFPLLPAERRYRLAIGWCRATVFVLRHLNGVRYRVVGADNLPADGPAVVLAKHQSAWETVALPVLLPRRLCYVFKRELLYIPFFGWTLKLLQMVHIDRRAGRNAFESVVTQGRTRMSEGAWVVMFPEGTRTPTGKQGKYKSGGARFAVATGAPVVPVAHNAGRVWPRNSFIKYPGIVTVSIGKPIDTTGLSPDEVNRRVESWIEDEMRRIDPAAYRSGHAAGATGSTDSASAQSTGR